MANITEAATYDAAVPQLETTTAATGGAGGAMNSQAQALANRTKYIKAILDSPSGLAALVQDASTSARGVVQLASTGIESATKVPKALGSELVALLTAAGYSISPATGADNLDNIADGTTYKRVLAAIATALNAGTYDAASVTAYGIGGLTVSTETDLNNYKTGGKYLTPTADTMTHVPTPLVAAGGRLLVEVIGDGSSYALQAIEGAISKKRIMRAYYSGGWTEDLDGNAGNLPMPKPTAASVEVSGFYDWSVTAGNSVYYSGSSNNTGTWFTFGVIVDASTKVVNSTFYGVGSGLKDTVGAGVLWRGFSWRMA